MPNQGMADRELRQQSSEAKGCRGTLAHLHAPACHAAPCTPQWADSATCASFSQPAPALAVLPLATILKSQPYSHCVYYMWQWADF